MSTCFRRIFKAVSKIFFHRFLICHPFLAFYGVIYEVKVFSVSRLGIKSTSVICQLCVKFQYELTNVETPAELLTGVGVFQLLTEPKHQSSGIARS